MHDFKHLAKPNSDLPSNYQAKIEECKRQLGNKYLLAPCNEVKFKRAPDSFLTRMQADRQQEIEPNARLWLKWP